MIDLNALLIGQGLLNVVLIVGVYTMDRRVKRSEREVMRMTAECDVVPTDPAIIAEWAATMARLPEGSPKWCAYRDRLTSLGYFTEEAVAARRS